MSASSLRIWVAVVVSALALLPGGPSFAAPGINSIAPAEARPDDIVTINGNGFGGPNVTVTVGGVKAKVVSATGNKVTFAVPRGLYPGQTTVAAANPGGNGGAIGFRVLLGFSVDSAATVSAQIGRKGGTLRTRSGGLIYTLTIPSLALDADTPITLTPVTSVANLPFSRGVPAAAQFGPSGLRLRRPGTLTVTRDAGAFPANLVGFLVDERGETLEVHGADGDGLSLSVPVEHFTVGGGGAPTVQDFESLVLPILKALPPTLPVGQVQQLLDIVDAWMADPGLAGICLQTTLCKSIYDIGIQSLSFDLAPTCKRMASFIKQGNAPLAFDASKDVVKIVKGVNRITADAQLLGYPDFDTPFDASCLVTGLGAIVDLASADAVANPAAEPIVMLGDIAATAAVISELPLQQSAIAALVDTIGKLLKQAANVCLADYVAGEALIDDVILTAYPLLAYDRYSSGLAEAINDVFVGCRVHIQPLLPSLRVGKQLQFSATTAGLSPSGVTWNVLIPTVGSSIDPATGLFTAGSASGTVRVVAASLANPNLKSQTIVTILPDVQITVSPASATISVGTSATFTAHVAGGSQLATWTATGGSIPPGPSLVAIYTAGSTPGTYSVTATSVDDPSKSQTMQVVVTAPGTLRGKIKFDSLYVATPVTYYGWTFGGSESVSLAADVVLQVKADGSVVVQSATGSYSHGHQADVPCFNGGDPIVLFDPVLGQWVTLGWNQEGLDQGADSGPVTGATFDASTGMLTLLGSTSGTSSATQGDCSVVTSPVNFPDTRLVARPGVIARQGGRIVKIDFTNSYSDPEYTETVTGVLQ